MDHQVGGGDGFGVVGDDLTEKIPLGGGHGTLDQMVFGVDRVTHDQARVDDDTRMFEHGWEDAEFFEAAEGKEELGGEAPPRLILSVKREERVGLEEVGVKEGVVECLGEELANGSFATCDRADHGNLVVGHETSLHNFGENDRQLAGEEGEGGIVGYEGKGTRGALALIRYHEVRHSRVTTPRGNETRMVSGLVSIKAIPGRSTPLQRERIQGLPRGESPLRGWVDPPCQLL